MSKYTEEADDVQFSEPILAQKGVRCGVSFAEKTEWEEKTKGVKNGIKKDACKLTLQISDDSVRTEHADAKPKLTVEDAFNIQTFIYEDKKTGEPKKLGRQKLFQLESCMGFDPCFQVDGKAVEPFVTKAGNKVAPKIQGKEVKRVVNPDFFNAYFDENGNPKTDNWIGKTIYADIEVEESVQYGNKNVIARYVKAPLAI
jgi:hypothetical protein